MNPVTFLILFFVVVLLAGWIGAAWKNRPRAYVNHKLQARGQAAWAKHVKNWENRRD